MRKLEPGDRVRHKTRLGRVTHVKGDWATVLLYATKHEKVATARVSSYMLTYEPDSATIEDAAQVLRQDWNLTTRRKRAGESDEPYAIPEVAADTARNGQTVFEEIE